MINNQKSTLKNIQGLTGTIKNNENTQEINLGIILGSGLSHVSDIIEQSKEIDYKEISGLHECTVAGHHSKLVLGTLGSINIACLQGRFHPYEGINENHQATFNALNAIKQLGCNHLIITNAAGSINTKWSTGKIVLIKDHINFSGSNPLVTNNQVNKRFVGMQNAYNLELRNIFHKVASKQGIQVPEGVYIGTLGPSFETPAEIRALRSMGGDLVGMSTVYETIIARALDMEVLAISVVSNSSSDWSQDQLSHEKTLKGAESNTLLINLIKNFILDSSFIVKAKDNRSL